MIRKTIRVRERSTATLEKADFRYLEDSAHFARLMDEGILSLERQRSTFGLKAGPHVGQALIGDVLVRVDEKVPGSLTALLAIAENPEARLADASSFIEEEARVLYALIDRFMSLLDRYLTYGREKSYQDRKAKSGLPRGKLLVADTMRLWATGRRDMLVYRYQELTPKTFLNQLIGLALQVADGILVLSEASRRRRVRTAAMLFEDTGWQELLRIPRDDLELRCKELVREDANVRSLISLARLLALHFGISTMTTEDLVPYSWFVNLETLFEECVLKTMVVASREAGLKATDWRAERRYVFAAEKSYRAEPDVVVWRDRTPLAIEDAKYKDLAGGTPDNADLYQLTSHAKAWKVNRAYLVFPSNENSYHPVGRDQAGIDVGYFMFDLRNPLGAARAMVQRIAPTPAATA